MSPTLVRHPSQRAAIARFLLFPGLLAAALASLAQSPAPQAPHNDGCAQAYCADDAVFQLSPLAALTAGVLESPLRFSTALAHGDFGLGGLSPLDGEAIVVDGIAWHAQVDGRLRRVAPEEASAALFVKRFHRDRTLALARIESLAALTRQLDLALAQPNRIHAIRIDGRFAHLQLRSVPRQEPPYVSVTEVVKSQQVFERAQVEGTLVGFYFPPYLSGVNAPGYHFHFVDRQRRWGGHVLGLQAQDLAAQIDSTRALTLVSQDDALFDRADLSPQATGGDAAFERALRPQQQRAP